jgi:hypothetical protein
MKTIYYATLSLLFSFLSIAAQSQDKAEFKSFGEFPSIIQCNNDQLLNCFNAEEGKTVTLSFSDQFSLTGNVVSNAWKYKNMQVVVIRVSNFENTLFKIVKQTVENNTTLLSGRILQQGGPEGYRMITDAKGNYLLEKYDTRQLVQDCFTAQ